MIISIHALVKRATKTPILIKADQNISIHALVKRATYTASYTAEMRRNFNPRPRKEGDTVHSGAQYQETHFNPRPRKEGDISLQIVK